MKFNDWLNVFVEEKGLDPYQNIEVKDNNDQTHIMNFECLLDAIRNSSTAEKKRIKDTLVKLDFINADVLDYFTFLAGAYVKTNF